MMFLRVVFCLALLVAWHSSGADSLRVCVSLPPLMTVAEAVGGDAVRVTSFMGENDDPHTFSPTPKAIAMLRDCDVFVAVGAAFEEVVTSKIRHMFPTLTVVDVGKGIDSRVASHSNHKDKHEHEHGVHCGALHDPHTWLSIPNLVRMGGHVRDALVAKLPQRKDEITANYAAFRASFERRHAEFAERLKPRRNMIFYVYHPVFGYFARDYGLVQESVEIDGKSPGPKQLMGLIKRARREGVRVIFVQPQFNDKPARILAKRIGGRVVRLNPLAVDPLSVMADAVDAICAVK